MDGITQNRLLIALYIFAIVVGITVRFVRLEERKTLFYDESWSYLNATGHLGEYSSIGIDEKYPIGNWVSASVWNRFAKPEKAFLFGKIRNDTVQLENHPPMYSEILHLWTLLWGAEIQAGLLLNIFTELIILLVLLQFAFELFGNLSDALLVCVAWVLSPISIQTSSWIRHYVLFTLVSLVFVYLVYKFIYTPEKLKIIVWQVAILAIVATIGMLTYYYFSLVIFATIIVVILKFKLGDVNRLISLFVVLLTACVLFILIFPNFYLQIFGYNESTFQLGWADFYYRVKRTLFLGVILLGPIFLILAILTLKQASRLKTVRLKYFWKIPFSSWQPATSYITGLALLTYGMIIFLYLGRVSPQHAMASKYVSVLAPFVALMSIFILKASDYSNSKVPLLFCLGMTIIGIVMALVPPTNSFQTSFAPTPDTSEIVVIDNIRAGILPVITYHLGENEVFAGSQEYLLNHQPDWLPRIREEGGYFVSVLEGSNSSLGGREKILDMLGENNSVERLPTMIWEIGDLRSRNAATYQVKPQTR